MFARGEPRRIWETDSDVENERVVAEELQRCWRLNDAIKLPKLYTFDWGFRRDDGAFRFFAEIKCRPGLSYAYGDGYYIALSKTVNASSIWIASNLPVFLVVRVRDGSIYWAELHRAVDRVIWAGRSDRPEDPVAMEPHSVIPWSMFKKLQLGG